MTPVSELATSLLRPPAPLRCRCKQGGIESEGSVSPPDPRPAPATCLPAMPPPAPCCTPQAKIYNAAAKSDSSVDVVALLELLKEHGSEEAVNWANPRNVRAPALAARLYPLPPAALWARRG